MQTNNNETYTIKNNKNQNHENNQNTNKYAKQTIDNYFTQNSQVLLFWSNQNHSTFPLIFYQN